MKRLLTCLLFGALFSVAGFTQKKDWKFGSISDAELKMTVYPKDSAAKAVILYESGDLYYEYMDNDFRICFEYSTRIKVLDADGVSYADVSIPYYTDIRNKEKVLSIEAVAYNLENGKVVKNKLDKQYIFDEQVNKNWNQKKFAVQGVKAGTVFEYRYKFYSDRFYQMPTWTIQHDIPVVSSRFECKIPEYFLFNTDMTGYVQVNAETTDEVQYFIVKLRDGTSENISCNSKKSIYSVSDVPALKEEPHVWSLDDFKSRIRFELRGIQYPFSTYQAYSNQWVDIDKLLSDDEDFGRMLKISNPYKSEVALIKSMPVTDEEKVRKIFALIQSEFIWNKKYAFYSQGIREAIKTKTGSKSDINFVLIAALKDAGYRACPVMMSRRSEGRLPYTYPSIGKLNTFVVRVDLGESGMVYMDASDSYADLNVLSSNLMVERARVFDLEIPENSDKWVDLTKLNKSWSATSVQASIGTDGVLTGVYKSSLNNQMAYQFKKSYSNYKNLDEYKEYCEKINKISIDSMVVIGVDSLSSQIKESCYFKKNLDVSGDYIYLNALIIPFLSTNQFTQKERHLPVEFDFNYTFKMNVALDIPEGYVVEELPKSGAVGVEDKSCRSVIRVQQVNPQQIMISYNFELGRMIFQLWEYDMLRGFFGNVVTQNESQLVLRKING